MAYFLRSSRRQMLIRNLERLGMPSLLAESYSDWPDNLRHLDQLLSDLVARLAERCRQLDEASHRGNTEAIRQHSTFMDADLAIFGAYCGEVRERNLSTLMLPKASLQIASTIRTIDSTKGAILAALGKTGPLQ